MKGWKLWAGGLALMLSGLGIMIQCLVDGDFTKLKEGIELFGFGLAAVGIGHKIEKASSK